MSIGDTYQDEVPHFEDPESGRTVVQHTSAPANSYPLYYFIPSHTADGRFLVVHSERTGWVQLYRLDPESGELVQLTEGTTRDAGWGIWCEYHLRGIYNHLSSINQVRDEVYYFQDDEVRCTHVQTIGNRRVHTLPGRIPIGQTGFSPDGRSFAFIHADANMFRREMADREALSNMKQWGRADDHTAWRNRVPTTISVIDTETGACRDVIELDYHVHHVFFLDNERLLVNHPRNHAGMWTVRLDGSEVRTLRPPDDHGMICHQVVTEAGIYYEANAHHDGIHTVWYGRYDPSTDTHDEVQLPGMAYVHTGFDPAGRFLFYENSGDTHEIASVHFPRHPDRFRLNVLRRLSRIPHGQRYHAHPFLNPQRDRMFFTDLIDGYSQVCSMDVSDLVDLPEYWDA